MDHMQIVCTLLHTDNHTSSLNFYRLDAFLDMQPTVSKHWKSSSDLLMKSGVFAALLLCPQEGASYSNESVLCLWWVLINQLFYIYTDL